MDIDLQVLVVKKQQNIWLVVLMMCLIEHVFICQIIPSNSFEKYCLGSRPTMAVLYARST